MDVYGWVTFPELIHLYSVGQMAPGPNMMMIVSIGEWVAGLTGALVVSSRSSARPRILTLLVGRLWTRLAKWPWRASIQQGLAPVSIGLLLAGCLSFARGAVTGPETAVLAGATLVVLLAWRVNPAYLILVAAVVGALSF